MKLTPSNQRAWVAMQAEVKLKGLPRHYRSDLELDRDLLATNPWRFAWQLLDCGTSFSPVYCGAASKGERKLVFQAARYWAFQPGAASYWWNGLILAEVSPTEMLVHLQTAQIEAHFQNAASVG